MVLTAEFINYVSPEYVVDDYVEDSSIRAVFTIAVQADLARVVTVTLSDYVATDYVEDDYVEGRDLLVSAALQAQGDISVVPPTLAATFNLSTTAAVQRSGSAVLPSIAAAQVAGGITLYASVATDPYVDGLYVEQNYYLGDTVEVSAAITASALVITPNYVYVDDPYDPYTWDSTGSTSWDDWPDNIWGSNGVTLHARTQLTAEPTLTLGGLTAMSAAASLTAAGNYILFGTSTAEAVFTQTAVGNHIFAGTTQCLADSELSATGHYILFGSGTFNSAATFTVAGGLSFNPQITLDSIAAVAIDQSGQNGIAGIFFTAAASVQAAAQFIIDQSGQNGTAGIVFSGQPETLQGFFSSVQVGVFIYRDPYRYIRVPAESRILVIEPREIPQIPDTTRIIKIAPETRIFSVREETRILTEAVPPYDTNRRRKI